jgi:3-oxoacyl-[acyl-carrier-protein] synthase II
LSRTIEWTSALVLLQGVTGHAMSASGALEAMISIEYLLNSDALSIDPEVEAPIPGCFVAATGRKPDVAVSNSFGFGGMNCSLVFEQG